MPRTLLALFENTQDLDPVINTLIEVGIEREKISIIVNDPHKTNGLNRPDEKLDGEGAAEGAGMGAGLGAMLGGVGGLLVGLGALIIPVVGPIIAAGPITVALTGLAGAGAGAIAGGVTGVLVGALVDAGIPENTAADYVDGLRKDRALLILTSENEHANDLQALIGRFHPVDFSVRENAWREASWSGHEMNGSLSDKIDADFRLNYENMALKEGSYEDYRSAYEMGYELASKPGFNGKEWSEVEEKVRAEWERKQPGQWLHHQQALRYGFERGRKEATAPGETLE